MPSALAATVKLPPRIEVALMKPRPAEPALRRWLRREGLQLSTYGVRDDGKLAAEHATASDDADCVARWNALLETARRDGYHRITQDPAGTLAFLREVARLHELTLQIALHGGAALDVTATCERWVDGTAAQRTLIARLLQCHLPHAATPPAAVAMADQAHVVAATRDDWIIEDAGRLRLASPLLATLASEGAPAADLVAFGLRYRLDNLAATALTVVLGRPGGAHGGDA